MLSPHYCRRGGVARTMPFVPTAFASPRSARCDYLITVQRLTLSSTRYEHFYYLSRWVCAGTHVEKTAAGAADRVDCTHVGYR